MNVRLAGAYAAAWDSLERNLAEAARVPALGARVRWRMDDAATSLVLVVDTAPCPTCTGPTRETTGLVCQTCGHDYG
jgi:hypothetical protein